MFYERFKTVCTNKKTTVTEYLKSIGMSTGNTGRWKAGGLPSGELLIKISNDFNVSVDYLLGVSDNPNLNK